MCGIIGYTNKNTTLEDLETLKKVLIESRIRGKHASGIAWYDGKTLNSHVLPIPIDELVEGFKMKKLLYSGSKVAMIAHARYSTSDIRYNQPIVGETYAIAHNGVISQSDPSTWLDAYGYQCAGKNDSELLLKAEEAGDNPFTKFPNASIAAVVLKNDGTLEYMRNGLRPLWFGNIGEGIVYASTYDILNRAGVKGIGRVITCDYSDKQGRDMRHEKSE